MKSEIFFRLFSSGCEAEVGPLPVEAGLGNVSRVPVTFPGFSWSELGICKYHQVFSHQAPTFHSQPNLGEYVSPSPSVTALFEGDVAGVEGVDESPAGPEEVFDVGAGAGTAPDGLLLETGADLVLVLLSLAAPLRQICPHSQGCRGKVQ